MTPFSQPPIRPGHNHEQSRTFHLLPACLRVRSLLEGFTHFHVPVMTVNAIYFAKLQNRDVGTACRGAECFGSSRLQKTKVLGTYMPPVGCTATGRRRPASTTHCAFFFFLVDVFSVTYSHGRFHPLWTLLIDQKGSEHETWCRFDWVRKMWPKYVWLSSLFI
jgi:hypothetical protein